VDDEGFACGWLERLQQTESTWTIDAEGYVADAGTMRRVTETEFHGLPPAVQIAARARCALDDGTEKIEVVNEPEWERNAKGKWVANKLKDVDDGSGEQQQGAGGQLGAAAAGTGATSAGAAAAGTSDVKVRKVNVNAARSMFATLISWGCKINADVVYTLDGSRARVGSGKSAYVASGRVAIAHDGSRVGGRLLEEPEGHDNYLAELAAQIDALMHAPAKSRVILVFDATSPVEAVRRYRRLHVRRKQGRHASGMLQTLERAIARHECVVFIWQPSHTGAPVNEWADTCAQVASDVRELALPGGSPRTASVAEGAMRHGGERMAPAVITAH
jgi:ribonuclease HI